MLQSTWVVAAVGCILYLGTTALVWRMPKQISAPQSRAGVAAKHAAVESWKFVNPEVDTLVLELRAQEDQLKAERAKLEEWAATLRNERQELNSITQQVYQMRLELDQNVVRIREEERDNLKKLAKTYSIMSPDGAAKILLQEGDEHIVKVLIAMKESESAPILEAMAAEPTQTRRVALLTERIRLSVGRSAAPAKAKST